MAHELRDDILQLPDTDLQGRYGPYRAHADLVEAANVAIGLGMPLLLTGQPGCGKTDFAQAVANALHAIDPTIPSELLECHIRSDSRARDLLYHYDALLRFTDGQHGDPAAKDRARDARWYIELRDLGIALTSRARRVVLIDEIDKAPRDLPNDLLRELDRGEFEIAEIPARAEHATDVPDHRTGVLLQRTMKRPDAPMPVVVITSNVERQLPDAFLRRCIFYHIPFPEPDDLLAIARLRFPDAGKRLLDSAVAIFCAARKTEPAKKPSTAELLDWIEALRLFRQDKVLARLERAVAAIDKNGTLVEGEDSRWDRLPAISCLFKLTDDWPAKSEGR